VDTLAVRVKGHLNYVRMQRPLSFAAQSEGGYWFRKDS